MPDSGKSDSLRSLSYYDFMIAQWTWIGDRNWRWIFVLRINEEMETDTHVGQYKMKYHKLLKIP